jgi:CheY-like chemotaxis protein
LPRGPPENLCDAFRRLGRGGGGGGGSARGGVQPTLVAVLSDIKMPGMDGLQLLTEIKQRRPDLPVMMVTAYGDEKRRRRVAELGGFRVHHQAGRFRAVEDTVASVARRGELRIALVVGPFQPQESRDFVGEEPARRRVWLMSPRLPLGAGPTGIAHGAQDFGIGKHCVPQ